MILINGILEIITEINSINIDIKKKAIDRKIDCIIWYIKKEVTCLRINAAIISQTKPTPPTVKYVPADKILSIG